MTWRRVVSYWLLFGGTLGYYVFTSTPRDASEAPRVATAQGRLLSARLDRIAEVEISRGPERVRCAEESGHWRVVSPPEVRVPADLIASFVVTLVEARVIERIAAGPESSAAFGFDDGATRVALYQRGHAVPLVIQLGAESPTRTAIYAHVEGAAEVAVVGRVLQYYVGRLFEEVRARRASIEGPAPGIDPASATMLGTP
jgi:hypothetical protein